MGHACACGKACCLPLLFPSLSDVEILQVNVLEQQIVITARDVIGQAKCRSCQTSTVRRHGSYRRRVHHGALEGRPIVVEIEVTRYRCDNPACELATFTLEIPTLARRRARRTPAMRATLEALARAGGGRMGARLATKLGLSATASHDSLLRLLRNLPEPERGPVTVLGVDDFARRKGQVYGTVLVDLDSNTVIDLLDDRQADTLAAWLTSHPEIEILCRDRAGAYADGAKAGAPQAIQVADRFHLWKNLIDYVDKTVSRHRADLPEPQAEAVCDGEAADVPTPAAPAIDAEAALQQHRDEGRIVPRTLQRHKDVHERLALGHSISQIARDLGLERATIRRYASATDPDELLTRSAPGNKATVLDGHTDYLHQRWAEGCHNAARLTRELQARGYRGSPQVVRRHLHAFRACDHSPAAAGPSTPSVREVTQWICTHPDRLDAADQQQLTQILDRSAPLAATAAHVTAFARMLVERTGSRENLTAWMAAVDADELPHLHSFTNGLRRDLDAVINGLTLPHNSGPVEGIVNKIKTIKRQMFGRANFDLLRIRVLHTI
jgi:transposase